MDNLLKQLNKCKTGCMVGDTLINHMLYADDLVVVSPYSAGLQELFKISSQYGVRCDIQIHL